MDKKKHGAMEEQSVIENNMKVKKSSKKIEMDFESYLLFNLDDPPEIFKYMEKLSRKADVPEILTTITGIRSHK